MQSRLPVRKSSILLEPVKPTQQRESRSSRNDGTRSRATSTSRAGSTSRAKSINENMPSYRRSKSSISSRRTPQSVLKVGSSSCLRNRSAERARQKKKDPRPIQDKKWQTEMTLKCQEYFQNMDDGRDVLNKGTRLRPMTLNMFVQLTDLVLHNIDPTFAEITIVNYIELIPQYLLLLKYPATVTPSTLKTANTMHAWPHILAIISWLVELDCMVSQFCLEMELFRTEEATIDEKTKVLEVKALMECFSLWFKNMPIPGELFENFEKNLRVLLDCSIGLTEKQIKETQDLQEQIEIKQRETNQWDQKLKNTKAEFSAISITDKAKKNKIEAKMAYCAKKDKEGVELYVTIDKMNQNLNSIQNDELEKIIRTQVMSVQERDNYLFNIEQLKSQLELVRKSTVNRQKISVEKELELSQTRRQLEQEINAFNISLMRPSLNYPELNALLLPETGFLTKDMLAILSDLEQKREVMIVNLNKEFEELNLNLQEKLSTFKMSDTALEKTMKEEIQKNIKNHKIQENIEQFKEQADSEEQGDMTKIIDLKAKLNNLVCSLPDLVKKREILERNKEEIKIAEAAIRGRGSSCLEYFINLQSEIRRNVNLYQDTKNLITKQVSDALDNISISK